MYFRVYFPATSLFAMSTSTPKKFFTIPQLMSTFNPGRTRFAVKSLPPVGTIICGITAMAGRRSLCLVNPSFIIPARSKASG